MGSSSPIVQSAVVNGINIELAHSVPYVAGHGLAPGEGVDHNDRATAALHEDGSLEVDLAFKDSRVDTSARVGIQVGVDGTVRTTGDGSVFVTNHQVQGVLDYLAPHTARQNPRLAAQLSAAAAAIRKRSETP